MTLNIRTSVSYLAGRFSTFGFDIRKAIGVEYFILTGFPLFIAGRHCDKAPTTRSASASSKG